MTETINKNTLFECFYSVLCILFILRIRNNLIFWNIFKIVLCLSLDFSVTNGLIIIPII